jgi:hypothetical protein
VCNERCHTRVNKRVEHAKDYHHLATDPAVPERIRGESTNYALGSCGSIVLNSDDNPDLTLTLDDQRKFRTIKDHSCVLECKPGYASPDSEYLSNRVSGLSDADSSNIVCGDTDRQNGDCTDNAATTAVGGAATAGFSYTCEWVDHDYSRMVPSNLRVITPT